MTLPVLLLYVDCSDRITEELTANRPNRTPSPHNHQHARIIEISALSRIKEHRLVLLQDTELRVTRTRQIQLSDAARVCHKK